MVSRCEPADVAAVSNQKRGNNGTDTVDVGEGGPRGDDRPFGSGHILGSEARWPRDYGLHHVGVGGAHVKPGAVDGNDGPL